MKILYCVRKRKNTQENKKTHRGISKNSHKNHKAIGKNRTFASVPLSLRSCLSLKFDRKSNLLAQAFQLLPSAAHVLCTSVAPTVSLRGLKH